MGKRRIVNIGSLLFRDFIQNVRNVQGNARIISITQFIWFIPYAMYTPLLTQYMKEIGLSNSQIGVINAITMITGVIWVMFAGWITDRMGRKRAYLLADMVSWAGACALWAIANNYLGFIIAGLFNSGMRLSGIPWNCLLTEEVEPKKRLSVFAVINLAPIVGGLTAPLINLLIHPLGLVPAMRLVLGITAIVYGTTFTVRHFFLTDSKISLQKREESKSISMFASLKSYIPLSKEIFASSALLALIILRAIYFVQMMLRNTYLSVTVVQGLNFGVEIMSVINMVTSFCMLLCQLFLVPKLNNSDRKRALYIGFWIGLVSNALLIFSPENSMIILMLSVVGNAAFTAIAGLIIDTVLANEMRDEVRAGLLGIMGLISVAVSVPFQYLGGYLADVPGIGNRMPMILISVIIMACIIIMIVCKQTKEIRPIQGGESSQ